MAATAARSAVLVLLCADTTGKAASLFDLASDANGCCLDLSLSLRLSNPQKHDNIEGGLALALALKLALESPSSSHSPQDRDASDPH